MLNKKKLCQVLAICLAASLCPGTAWAMQPDNITVTVAADETKSDLPEDTGEPTLPEETTAPETAASPKETTAPAQEPTASGEPSLSEETGGADETTAAPAETTGDFTVTGGAANADYSYQDHVLTILTATPLLISGTTVSDRIVVAPGVNACLTLSGVSIQLPESMNVPALQIADESSGAVTIILADGSSNVLQGGKWSAGLQKDGAGSVGTLTIRCAHGNNSGHVCTAACGLLKATGLGGAGIGGGASQDGTAHAVKNITIISGRINAAGKSGGSGIGAGSGGSAEGIAIRGGIVEAAGGDSGAGIGEISGAHAVTVSGGVVTAKGSGGKPGIGGKLVTADASGRPGNAYIVTDKISDTSGKDSWSGVILQGNEGAVYGASVVLRYSVQLPAGVTFTIPAGAGLAVETGAVLTFPENTVLRVDAGGSLSVRGQLQANGKMRVDGRLDGEGQVTGADVKYLLAVKGAAVKVDGSAKNSETGLHVKAGSTVTLTPEKPETLTGWKCVPQDLKIENNQFTMPSAPVEIEALYKKEEYTVTFDLNGGTADTAPEQQTVVSGGKAASPKAQLVPPAGKCMFDGWYTQEGKRWNFDDPVNAPMVLTAHWKEHSPDTAWTFADGKHYHACANGCGEHLDEAECSGGTATCQQAAVCSVCGGTYKPVDPQNHAGGTRWETTAEGHLERYTCCEAVKTEQAAHVWNTSGVCSVCGYSCAHTKTERKNRKSATCTTDGYTGDTVCTVCKAVLTEGSRVSRTGHSYYGSWDSDGSGHWLECADCGRKGKYEAHTFSRWQSSDGQMHEQCSVCGYQVTLASSPGGGAPTSGGTQTRPQTGTSGGTPTGPVQGPPTGGTATPVPGQTPAPQTGTTAPAPGQTPGSQPATTAPAAGQTAGQSQSTGQSQKPAAGNSGKPAQTGSAASSSGSGKDNAATGSGNAGTQSGTTSGQQKPSGSEPTSPEESDFWGPSVEVTVIQDESPAQQWGLDRLPDQQEGASSGSEGEQSLLAAAAGAVFGIMPWWMWLLVLAGGAAVAVAIPIVVCRYDDGEEE